MLNKITASSVGTLARIGQRVRHLHTTQPLESLQILSQIRDCVTTFPVANLVLSHGGAISRSSWLHKGPVKNARDIELIRGSILNGNGKYVEDGEDLVERFVLRAQSPQQRKMGNIGGNPIPADQINMEEHQSGRCIAGLSTTRSASVARLFAISAVLSAINPATVIASLTSDKAHPSPFSDIVLFDAKTIREGRLTKISTAATNSLTSSESLIAEPGSSYDWEHESLITTIPTPFSRVCHRPYFGPFGIAPLVFNELYVPIDRVGADFLVNIHVPFTEEYEKICSAHIVDGKKLVLQPFIANHLTALCTTYLRSFLEYDKLGVGRSVIMDVYGASPRHEINIDAAQHALQMRFDRFVHY